MELENVNLKSQIYKIVENNNNIYIMRDDLIPFSFGGNKARKAKLFFEEILKGKYNYVVTYGSASSNHCRIISNLAMKYSIPCTIISTSNEENCNNRKLCNLFNAQIVVTEVDNVKDTIDNVLKEKEQEGFKPYFIQGGGHGNIGTQAYIDAYKEIVDFEQKNNIEFDYIFHASGTGTTQAGLVLGNILNNSNANVVGISVARRNPYGRNVVIDSIYDYIKERKLNINFNEEKVIFDDNYILEGYGRYNNEIINTIVEVLKIYGIPLDTTYTGKAFWGMTKYIEEYNINNKNILFIHTGGCPIFFDKIDEICEVK